MCGNDSQGKALLSRFPPHPRYHRWSVNRRNDYRNYSLQVSSLSCASASSLTARAMAPCFLLLDNIEVMLGISPAGPTSSGAPTRNRRREGHRTSHQAIDRILSTLLMEMDGIRQPSSPPREVEETVVVIATSLCHPSELDSAIIRPGRLEEHIQILPPTEVQVSRALHSFPHQLLASPNRRSRS